MHDIKFIRENPKDFDAAMQLRGVEPCAEQILALDAEKRQMQTTLGEKQAERNALAKAIGQAKRNGEDAAEVMAQAGKVTAEVKAMEAQLQGECPVTALLEALPNLPDAEVPFGKGEEENVELRTEGAKPDLELPAGAEAAQHFDLGERLGNEAGSFGAGLMDFELGAKLSGSRFVVLRGALARMERALAQFMLDQHREQYGFEEVSPPFLVRDAAMYGTGQLPKFCEDSFQTTEEHWLIPTAEVSLTNLVAGEILAEEELPLRFTAFTPCFRSEAGSAGRDTRGMIRQHQFSKVEMVSITHPDAAKAEHDRMLDAAENILRKLGLHYRVMLLSSGDMGFSANKTYDIEVWLPGQNAYREISSVSNCGEFQARRMKARCRKAGEKKTQFVHTLNGSGLAVGRTMVALLENYQQADGSIVVPEVLRPYMGGMERIS